MPGVGECPGNAMQCLPFQVLHSEKGALRGRLAHLYSILKGSGGIHHNQILVMLLNRPALSWWRFFDPSSYYIILRVQC